MISDFTKEEKDENVANANTLTQENFERHLAAMAAAAAAAAAHGSTTGSSRSSSSFLIKDILFPRSKVGYFFTVWGFVNFPATQILREINFG